jgi:hypothetical protein
VSCVLVSGPSLLFWKGQLHTGLLFCAIQPRLQGSGSGVVDKFCSCPTFCPTTPATGSLLRKRLGEIERKTESKRARERERESERESEKEREREKKCERERERDCEREQERDRGGGESGGREREITSPPLKNTMSIVSESRH